MAGAEQLSNVILLTAAIASSFLTCSNAYADCVYGAKSKSSYVLLDQNTIMLTDGFGPDIVIKTWTYLNRFSSISVLKDSFCSYESAVLYIDGTVVDANQVTKLN